jgi:GNAT superfamily N-acetyltransferase
VEQDKIVLGCWADGELVAVVDVLRRWPDAQTAHIGLLLVRGDRQRTGLGRATFAALTDLAREWVGIRSWRAAIVRTNEQVAGFWRQLGFAETGEVKPYRYDRLSSEAVIFAREVGD